MVINTILHNTIDLISCLSISQRERIVLIVLLMRRLFKRQSLHVACNFTTVVMSLVESDLFIHSRWQIWHHHRRHHNWVEIMWLSEDGLVLLDGCEARMRVCWSSQKIVHGIAAMLTVEVHRLALVLTATIQVVAHAHLIECICWNVRVSIHAQEQPKV